jgi:hypothetical protein
VKYWNRIDPEAESEEIIDDPGGEHLLAEKRWPAESERDAGKGENQPFGADVAEATAAAAMRGSLRRDDSRRLFFLRRVAIAEIEPERQHRAEERDQRPDDIHDPHRLRPAPFVADDYHGTEEAESERRDR